MEHTVREWLTYFVIVAVVWYRYHNVWHGKTPAWARSLPKSRHSYRNTVGNFRPVVERRRALKRHVAQPGRLSFFAACHA